MCFLVHSSMEQILFAGFPATILFDGILPCNTAPPPQIVLSPISVPGKIKHLAPIKQFSPIFTNFHRFQKMTGCFLSNCLQAFHNREIVRKNNHVARNCGIFSD